MSLDNFLFDMKQILSEERKRKLDPAILYQIENRELAIYDRIPLDTGKKFDYELKFQSELDWIESIFITFWKDMEDLESGKIRSFELPALFRSCIEAGIVLKLHKYKVLIDLGLSNTNMWDCFLRNNWDLSICSFLLHRKDELSN